MIFLRKMTNLSRPNYTGFELACLPPKGPPMSTKRVSATSVTGGSFHAMLRGGVALRPTRHFCFCVKRVNAEQTSNHKTRRTSYAVPSRAQAPHQSISSFGIRVTWDNIDFTRLYSLCIKTVGLSLLVLIKTKIKLNTRC